MPRWILGVALAVSLVLAGCGASSSSSSSRPKTSSTDPSVTAKPAGATPSESAQMVCAREAQFDISSSLGITPTQVTTPTWVDHVYSCTYVYPTGKIVLSVKELDNLKQTLAYYDAMRARLGQRPGPIALGQGAFVTTTGSVVVRKDFKVLLVDVTGLPARFGQPPLDRSDAALSVGATVMSCWTGA